MIRYLPKIIIISALVFAQTAFAAGWQSVKDAGVLTIGIEGTYQPFNFMNEENQPDGFDVDVARAIGKTLGVKVKFVETQWTALIGGVKANKFDAIAADMTITSERAKSVNFTKPYNATGAVLVCRQNDAKYHSLADLKGARVGAGAGTTYATLAKSAPGADVVLYDSFPAYLNDLMNKRLDVIINAKSLSNYVINKHNYPLKVCSGILNKKNIGLIGMAVNKENNMLLQKLNDAIGQLVGSAEYTQIYSKWFGKGVPLLLQWKRQHQDS